MPRKLTARQLLRDFPTMAQRHNCLENMACPACGQREELRVEIKTMGKLVDDGTDAECGDHEWGGNSYCECREGRCTFHGRVRDFTFPGLDSMIEDVRSRCDCDTRSWVGPDHDSACPVTIFFGNGR